MHEIQKLINTTKEPIRYSFFYTIPEILKHTPLIGKKIYIQGDSQYNFPVAVVNQNNTFTLDSIDYGDQAYLVFVVERND
jgi:hypothetical protein